MSSKRDNDAPFFPPYLGLALSEDEESTEDKIKKFVESSQSVETNRNIHIWIKRFRQHCEQQNGAASFEQLSKTELNTLLCSFLIDARKANGDGYETTTIHCIFSIIGRYFKDNQQGDLEKDIEYQGARDVKKAKLKMLKADGKGNLCFARLSLDSFAKLARGMLVSLDASVLQVSCEIYDSLNNCLLSALQMNTKNLQ